MSFVQFFNILWVRRGIILLCALCCFGGAVFVAKILPARYEAKSRVMMDLFKPDPVTGEVITSQFARAYVKTQVELIKDYRIAGQVVDELSWANSPTLAAQYGARGAADTRDFRRWLAQRVIDSTNVGLIEGSNILEIGYTSTGPEAARKVADTIRKAYVDQMLSLRREDAANNAEWFRNQAKRIRDELSAAEKRKADFERENNIVLADDDKTDSESTRLAALASTAPAQAVAGPVISLGSNGPSPQLAQANAAIAAAERVLGPNNPDLIDLRRQRDAIAAASVPARAAAAAAASGPSIASLYNAQQAKVLAQRGKVNEARQLAADVAVLRDQYLKTSARAADLSQQGESTETGLTLLGNAVAPTSPSFPRWPLVIIGSIGLGFGLGVVLALATELLSRRVRGVDDLQIEGVPVLGIMARPARLRRGLFSFWRRRPLEEAYA